MKNIDLIRKVTQSAAGQWPFVLTELHIDVPDSPRKHAACPVCGGKDRFRFDDNGRGSFICNQCGAGDGLDLIQKVNNCNATEAAVMVADVLSIDYRAAEKDDTASQRNDQREAERRKHEQERQQQAAAEAEKRRAAFSAKYQALMTQSTPGQAAYLTAKGLEYPLSLLPDGSLLLALTNGDGAVTGAQTIKPDGEKRLVAGTVKKGSFFTVNASDNPQTVVVGEGLATVLSVHLMRPDALAVVAVDAGNLLPVAKVMLGRYPDAKIIIAADNDIRPGEPNTGRDAAEKAAISVSGWMVLPPTEEKADWNDYHQANGLEAATAAFNDSMYQPECEKLAVKLKAIDGGKKSRKKETVNISQMATSQKARLLSARWEKLAVNPGSGAVYCYSNGVWEKLADSELERVMASVFECHEAHYTEKGIKSVVATMKLQLPALGDLRGDLIGFTNGVYDLTSQTFNPHSADNWLMNHNGITYTHPAPGESIATHAPGFTRWLNHATGGDSQKGGRIKAALFMVLAKRHDWQLFIEVTGEGGSGKSVFSSIATMLAGEHNTASGSMSTLDLARGRAQFVGKSLIIIPDQTRYVGEGSGIKAITGGDPVEIDGKYEKQFTTVLSAVVIATNNEPMTFTERNGGIARRRVIFPFNNPVSEEDKDPELAGRIRREIPVIIRHLLNEFSDPNRAKALLLEQRQSLDALNVKRGTDPVIDMCAALYFMSEPKGMMMGGGTWAGQPEPRKYLYQLYLAFLEYHGLGKPLSVNKFSRAIKSAAREYRESYLTRNINGRAQTNVGINELAEEFIPRAYGVETGGSDE
ncbi:DNA primase [Salmonella enterica subsp. enterica]|nr:DNA primase [Salmonella enterica subsp. enterica serovar Sandiego]EDV5378379.1 DNA primase [Salmonella enterica subsp. enterica serovar Sandiego]EDW2377007.1 DNA primase [Salmonella enterica subsp. enterica serovar Sandiego]